MYLDATESWWTYNGIITTIEKDIVLQAFGF
jgi:hypothetical protein